MAARSIFSQRLRWVSPFGHTFLDANAENPQRSLAPNKRMWCDPQWTGYHATMAVTVMATSGSVKPLSGRRLPGA
jgi:hypothetical protein